MYWNCYFVTCINLFIWPSKEYCYYCVDLIRLEFGNKDKTEFWSLFYDKWYLKYLKWRLHFDGLNDKRYLKYFTYEWKMRDWSKCPLMFPINHSGIFFNKPLSKKIEEIICEGLKWVCCFFFELYWQKDF